MFLLLRLRDTIEIEPAYFSPEKLQKLPPPLSVISSQSGPEVTTSSGGDALDRYTPSHEDVLWHRVSERYVGKVIPSRGLCIAIAELIHFSNSTIRGSDGSSWTSVTFDAVVLRPDVGERLRANIHRQTEKGIYLSVELFHDIFVPASHLVQPSIFDDNTGIWHLNIEDEDGSGAVTLNPYRKDDEVIVAVRDVVVRSSVDLLSADESNGGGNNLDDDSPMVVIGSFLDVGLGPCVWFE